MKRNTVSVLALLVSVVCFGQPSKGFKQIHKEESGSTRPDLVFKTISGHQALKATIPQEKFQIAPLFTEPALLADSAIKRVVRSERTRLPVYIEMERKRPGHAGEQSFRDEFHEFFEKAGSSLQVRDPQEELAITGIMTDKLGMTHVRAKQQFRGVEVYGGEAILHFSDTRTIFTGQLFPVEEEIGVIPGISAGQALEIVTDDLKKNTLWREISPGHKKVLKYKDPVPNLVIYHDTDQGPLLCYETDLLANLVERWIYFVDANNGTIIHTFNTTQSDGPVTATAIDLNGIERTINTYLEEDVYYMINTAESMFNDTTFEGAIWTLDANNTSSDDLDYSNITSMDNTWDHPSGVSAHFNTTATYRYLENTFGRNSLNDQGGDIVSFVNVTNEDGTSMENAYWTGYAAFYGNGGEVFQPLAGALDVTAHELGHGVVSNTANLEYYGQSGAVNETYADFFGAMVDREDWLIGEDVTSEDYFPSGALRDMSNPHNMGESIEDYQWQPMHVDEMYIGEEDNGGVHINSGIGNYAYYLYATAITREKAEQVFYRALTTYLTKKSQFVDFRLAVVQSAVDLYGEGSTEVTEAEKAFDAVGIFEEEQVDYEQHLPVNDGDEYLLTIDTDTVNENTLYRSSVVGDDFYALSTTLFNNKPSVMDNGAEALFISDDHMIRAINTDPDNPNERIISQEAFWYSVAISKDGNRVACTSIEIDTAIYVYDYISQEWAKFILYNPTTSHEGTDAGGVLFADAIQFDHSGEYVIYDAYNELATTAGGENIDYWDIGFIRVWDNLDNTWGDGTVEKLYGSLPADASIGNPVFSNNSPHIIAFDYWDSYDGYFGVVGANLLTGEEDGIVGNWRLGYPSFSRLDDKIAYTTYDVEDNDLVAEIALAPNKISPAGDPAGLVGYAKWPVYYATGTRSLELAPVSNFTCDHKTGDIPLSVRFIDLSVNMPTGWEWTFEGGDPSTSMEQNPVVVYNTVGAYQVTLTTTNNAGNNTLTKSEYITVVDATGMDDASAGRIRLYPNPVTDVLHIECNQSFGYRIFSLTGRLMVSGNDRTEVDMGSFEPGIYVMVIETGDRILYQKVIRE